ncbi:unnamed protein product, partial [marine sediment metagenome]
MQFLAIIVLLYYYFSEIREKTSAPELARAIAMYTLRKFRNLPM